MLEPYWGEFLVSPIPLELALNYCSFKCAYCFANLNLPTRTANVTAIMNLLADYPNRTTLAARLLQQGYPVLISNKVDPFAHSNIKQSLPIMRHMVRLGIPLSIQTRAGIDTQGVEEVLSFLPPSVWYISIATLDDELRKTLEPGAPAINARFHLIEKLCSLGHRVVLGLNPIVPEWCPDPKPLLRRAKDAGVEGTWIEMLHLSRDQVANMSPKEQGAIGEEILMRCRHKRRIEARTWQTFIGARNTAQELGLEVFSIGQGNASNFFAPFRALYPKTFPIMQDIVNACHANADLSPLSFAQFADLLTPQLPTGTLPIAHYIGSVAHKVLNTFRIPSQMNFRQLLAVIWQEPAMKCCPVRTHCFAYLAERENDEWVELVDERSMRWVVFYPEGVLTYYAEEP